MNRSGLYFVILLMVFISAGCLSNNDKQEVSKQLKMAQEEYYEELFDVQKKGFDLADEINEEVKYFNQLDKSDGGIPTQEKTDFMKRLMGRKDQLVVLQSQKSAIQSKYTEKIQKIIGEAVDPDEKIFKQELREYTPY